MKKFLLFITLFACIYSCKNDDDAKTLYVNIKGAVVIESGDTITNLNVTLLQNNIIVRQYVTGNNGIFEFVNLPAGKYTVKVANDYFKESGPVDIDVVKSIDNFIIVVEFNPIVLGRLEGLWGEKLENEKVWLQNTRNELFNQWVYTAKGGLFAFYDIPDGIYDIYFITPEAKRKIVKTIRIIDGQPVTIILKIADSGTFIDKRDGREYKWVTVGNQIWMAENLAYLPKIDDVNVYSYTIPYYYVYGISTNNSSFTEEQQVEAAKATEMYKTYGVLYNWQAASGGVSSSLNPSGVQGVCPDGWHLPSYAEYSELKNFVEDDTDNIPAGKLLKAKGNTYYGTGLWASNQSYESIGIDEYGLSFIPGGIRYNSYFSYLNSYNYNWTSTQNGNNGHVYYLYYIYNSLNNSTYSKQYGLSVRCVKNVEVKKQ